MYLYCISIYVYISVPSFYSFNITHHLEVHVRPLLYHFPPRSNYLPQTCVCLSLLSHPPSFLPSSLSLTLPFSLLHSLPSLTQSAPLSLSPSFVPSSSSTLPPSFPLSLTALGGDLYTRVDIRPLLLCPPHHLPHSLPTSFSLPPSHTPSPSFLCFLIPPLPPSLPPSLPLSLPLTFTAQAGGVYTDVDTRSLLLCPPPHYLLWVISITHQEGHLKEGE